LQLNSEQTGKGVIAGKSYIQDGVKELVHQGGNESIVVMLRGDCQIPDFAKSLI